MKPPELPPYRPPSEAESALVRVTRGCAWNRCTFCGMYKTTKFEVRSPEEIAEDLPALRELFPGARSVFLADSDSLVHPKLPEIVRSVRAAFPEADRITSYSRLHTLWRRAPEWLRELRAAGLTRVHAGLESGSARVLEACRKGAAPEVAIEGGRKAIDAGFELSLYVLCGLGGENGWEEHAMESARVTAEIVPRFVRLRSLALVPGTPLHDAWTAGSFAPVSPLTRLRETRRLAEELAARLTVAGREVELTSDHVTNYVWADGELVYGGVNGFLPGDAPLLLETLDRAIAGVAAGVRVEDAGALALRGRIVNL
jgi:radical SAM superfamily enzyme YgiQ (UPF0313 family)